MITPLPFADTIQAILFDMDGTLVDSDDRAVANLAGRLRPLLGQRAPGAARWLWMKAESPGNALITFLDWLHLDRPVMAFAGRLRGRDTTDHGADAFPLIPGVAEMLQTVYGRYRLGLVTTRDRAHIDSFFNAHPELASLFTVSCGSQDTVRLKPHPAPVWQAAAQLGMPPGACLMVGDTTMDVQSGRRAGAKTVAVLCGFGERPELERAGADVILESTAELAARLGM